jgi:cytosine/creatinine deaminase
VSAAPHALTLRGAKPSLLRNARLPRWLLPTDWPQDTQGRPALAQLHLKDGRIESVRPMTPPADATPHAAVPATQDTWDLAGAPVLPGLVDAHTHLDKTFTLQRIGTVRPGLLAAIEAMMGDRAHWTHEDIHARASQALQWAWEAGVTRIRSHVDWWEPSREPLGWAVLGELAQEWAGRIHLERAALIPQTAFEDREQAGRLARHIASSGKGALLGGFIHTHHWTARSATHLLQAAAEADLDLDLHVDEELNPAAEGLALIARTLREIGCAVCGHVCALSAQPEAQALSTLDAVAQAPITLVSLPITNLLLQDAVTGRTPRQRGITLVKEARERGIPVLLASDNVEDPFCAIGSYDPVEAFATGVQVAQLPDAFDTWSEALCRGDWLDRHAPTADAPAPALTGRVADLVIFTRASVSGWPSRAQARVVLRAGERISISSSDCDTP